MHTDITTSLASLQTGWGCYYISKPTDINACYPTTEDMMDALEDATLEHRVRFFVRIITVVIALSAVVIAYMSYPDIALLVLDQLIGRP